MSASESAGRTPSTSESIGLHPDMEMDLIGWAIFLTLLVVVIPLLPFVAVYWVVSWIVERVSQRGS